MSSPNINSWYYVKLTLKSKEDGTTTKTLRLSNRPLVDEADGATVYYPILKSISNIGSEAGDTIPIAVSGSIVLDDSPGTIGLDRRFSDLTEKWQLIGGVVNIYSANTTADDIAITADFNLDWTTEIIRARKNGDQFEISVSEQGLSQNTMTRVIPSTGINNLFAVTTVNSNAIGQSLPLVFGSSQVVSAINTQTTNGVYAYATVLGGDFAVGGVQGYYIADHAGDYRLCRSGDKDVAIWSQTSTTTNVINTDMYATFLKHDPATNNYLITKVDVYYQGFSSGGSYVGTLSCRIFEGTGIDSTLGPSLHGPGREIALAKRESSDYSASLAGASAFWITYYFNVPVVLSGTKGFWIGTSYEPISGPDDVYTQQYDYGGGGPTLNQGFYYKNGNWVNFGGDGIHAFKFYGIKFVDRPQGYTSDIDSSGLCHAYFSCELPTMATQQTVPLGDLSVIVSINGLVDGGGAITGTPGTVIKEPHHVLKILDYKYNGSNWTSTGQQLDFTAFSSTLVAAATATYPRQIKGFVSQRSSVAEIMGVVCANSAYKIVRYNGATKSFTVYGWGYRQATQAVITDEDAKVLGIEYLGTETIVNVADINYDRSLLNFNPIQNFDNTSIYNYSSKYNKATAGPFSSLSTISDLLFSKRELNNTGFDLLSPDSATYVDSMAQYFMGVYAYPHVYVTIEIPLFKFRTLDLMQVIEIVHPSLPAYFGSNPDTADPYYAAGGAANDILDGEYLKQAQRYRAQIESKTLNYNLGDFPTMILKCRLLINPNDPT